MDADTIVCPNCRRSISTCNYTMHEAHCRRHISLCKLCEQPIPKADLEHHISDLHSVVDCPQCHQSIEKDRLRAHLDVDCCKKQVMCPFCELNHMKRDFAEHLDFCGSRTEQCPDCHQYIMLVDWQMHVDTLCNFPEPKKCTNAGRKSPIAPMYDTDFYHNRYGLQNAGDGGCFVFDEMNRLLVNQGGLLNGEGSGDIRIDAGDRPPKTQTLSFNDEHENLIPCEFCGSRYIVSSILQHQAMCDALPAFPASENADDHLVADVGIGRRWNNENRWSRDYLNDNDRNRLEPVTDVSRSSTKSPTDGDLFESLLPCEFCSSLHSPDSLLLHQGVCDAGPDEVTVGSQNLFLPQNARHNASNSQNHTSNINMNRNPISKTRDEPRAVTKKLQNKPIKSQHEVYESVNQRLHDGMSNGRQEQSTGQRLKKITAYPGAAGIENLSRSRNHEAYKSAFTSVKSPKSSQNSLESADRQLGVAKHDKTVEQKRKGSSKTALPVNPVAENRHRSQLSIQGTQPAGLYVTRQRSETEDSIESPAQRSNRNANSRLTNSGQSTGHRAFSSDGQK